MKRIAMIALGTVAVLGVGAFAAFKLFGNQIVWNMMWGKYEKQEQAECIHLAAGAGHGGEVAVYDALGGRRVDAYVNTHRAIYLPQAENGSITSQQLAERLDGEVSFSESGALLTADGKPGIAGAKATYCDRDYDVVFVDLPFYSEQDDRAFEAGGILTGDLVVEGHRTLAANLLVTGTVHVGKGAQLDVVDGVTLTAANMDVEGVLQGYATGNLHMGDGGSFNGELLLGDVTASGSVTLEGMLIGDRFTAEDGSTVLMKEFGGLFTAADLGENVTLRFEDGEPLFLEPDWNKWIVDTGENMSTGPAVTGENTTGGSWYLSNACTPTDILGQEWSEPLTGSGVLRCDIGGLGYVKNESDLRIEVVGESEHNFAMMVMNRNPITHVSGNIEVYVNEGYACPDADKAAVGVGKLETDPERDGEYVVDATVDAGYEFESSEELAVKAVMGPTLKKASSEVSAYGWKIAHDGDTYTFYGYTGEETNHWTGPTGTEACIVRVRVVSKAD
ncbi:hypothetical protein [Paratractidigestivibacter sp.]|uniref:hypothetical protein n=1 Tax=Paratractidigestivibacter sp. TaxID=2847316 RepID=UPI002ACB069A|nr:hypothetical protein [Paratractidigestivibacter sp.]